MSKKCVLITGCASGIGKALALECHKQNLKTIASARNVEKLSELEALGIECVQLDVNKQEDIDKLIQHLKSSRQAIDFLINNAGYGLIAPMVEITRNQLEEQFQTNVFSIVNLTNTLLPFMLKAPAAQIINIGSVSGILTTPFSGAYCASKSALHSLTEAYRMELAPLGIKVLLVQPGAIRSGFGDKASQLTQSLLKEDSFYKSLEHAIRRRANASQENPSSAEDFAETLVKNMLKSRPPLIMRIGKGSTLLPLLARILKASLLDRFLSKAFKLDKLNKTNIEQE